MLNTRLSSQVPGFGRGVQRQAGHAAAPRLPGQRAAGPPDLVPGRAGLPQEEAGVWVCTRCTFVACLGSPFTCCSDHWPPLFPQTLLPPQQIDVERTKLARFFATVDEYQILQPRAAVARIASLIRARGMYPRDAFRAFNFRYMHEAAFTPTCLRKRT